MVESSHPHHHVPKEAVVLYAKESAVVIHSPPQKLFGNDHPYWSTFHVNANEMVVGHCCKENA